MANMKVKWQELRESPQFLDKKSGAVTKSRLALMKVFRIIIFIGISYVILSPVIGIVSRSFFSDADQYNPMVFTIPAAPTLERYQEASSYMNYWVTTGRTLLYTIGLTLLQLLVCSMAGYGFARFDFPFKKILFGE